MVLDASIWVSRFVDTEPMHAITSGWMDSAEFALAAPIVVPLITLTEVSGAVARRAGSEYSGLEALAAILDHPLVRLDEMTPREAEHAARVAARLRLRGMDAIYVALAADLGAPLLTWDEDQIRRGAGLVEVRRPG